jgi:hypothetical protein
LVTLETIEAMLSLNLMAQISIEEGLEELAAGVTRRRVRRIAY